MPPTETPTEPSQQPPSTEPSIPDAAQDQPTRIMAGRYGELDTHELITLLDSIEDERARSRFRESMYVSIFVWLLIAWVFTYGTKYWWHPPKLKVPVDVHERELTQLNLPNMPKALPPVVKPAPRPTIDTATMDRLRAMARQPAPQPATPEPSAPVAPPPPPPPNATAPAPRIPPPVVAEAPTMQPSKPTFDRPSSAGDSIRSALNDNARNRNGGNLDLQRPPAARNTPLNLGGVEVLSDMQGVDFGPYLRRIYYDVYRNWLPLIPQETLPPLNKEGETWIRFTILPDGTVGEMHLDGSTHDDAINRSAWGSITTEGQFPPLPSQFHGPNLTLRYHYIVRKAGQE
jgi:hypothetical protein